MLKAKYDPHGLFKRKYGGIEGKKEPDVGDSDGDL